MLMYKIYNIKLIHCLKISISVNKTKTYWGYIKNSWKRIAREYFFILQKKGIEVVFKSISIFKKNQCLGITKQGVQCSRLVLSSKKYCFQHKVKKNEIVYSNDLNLNQNRVKQDISVKQSKQLDQYYTIEENAILCTEMYNKFVKVDKDKDVIIEPSAGSGSFITSINLLCNNSFFIDIDPKHNSIVKGDFLKFNINLDKFEKVHIIGNPPFNSISKFIMKASKIADNIGFILPLSFCKNSLKKKIPLHFHCICEHILIDTRFYFNNSLRKVPTIFQIWEKRDYKREKIVNLTSTNIEFVKKKENPILAFRRVGSKAGEISAIIHDKSESSHYFIKLKNNFDLCKFFKIYRKIKFVHNNTVGVKSISQQELLFELKKYGV